MTDAFIDIARGEPLAPSAVRAAGFAGVIGVLGPEGDEVVVPAVVEAYRAAELDVLLAWSPSARRELSGRHGGERDGELVCALARSREYPGRCAVYVALSVDAASADLPALTAYLRGFADACGHPVGVRGSARLVEAVLTDAAAVYGWQTQAWSGGYVSPKAHLYQRVFARHTRLDGFAACASHENVVLRPDCGAWGVHGAPDRPRPDPGGAAAWATAQEAGSNAAPPRGGAGAADGGG